jgi:dihydroorotase
MGIPAGSLAVGAAADICVFDPKAETIISRDRLKSQGRNTPFLGLPMAGRVKWTLVDGVVAFGD